ncbi:unnamed protein product [Cercospora beticola]|nr:unnamed protein product [Cercospora beticola]
MRSQYWHCLLAVLILPTLTVATIPQIKNVFQIDYRKASQYKSSCVPHVNKFGTMWLQMHEMTANAIDALSPKKYNDPKEARTRTLLYSFFGIAPKEKPDSNGYEYSINEITRMQQQGRGEPENTYNRKLSAVRTQYQEAQRFLTYEQRDGPDKPRILCDSTFLSLQRADDEVKDVDGKAIPKDPNRPAGEKWKLKEWEQTKCRRNFETNWYFWYTFNAEQGYFVLPKFDFPAKPKINTPWDLDPRTKKPSACHENDAGWVFSPLEKPTPIPRDDKSAPWTSAQWVILCPSSWQGNTMLRLPETAPPEGAEINTLDTTAMTFYHELWHLVDEKTLDYHRVLPIRGKDLTSKSHFTRDGIPIRGGKEALTLGKWENANPITRLHDAQTIKSAESFAWFGLTLMAQKKYDRDFSTGVCRKDSPEAVGQSGPSSKTSRNTKTTRSTKSRRSIPTMV